SVDDAASWSGVTDALVLPAYRSGELAGLCSVPEIASIAGLIALDAMDRADQARATYVQSGTDREAVWTKVLEPLASHAKRVYIIDHYASESLARDIQEG